MQRRGRGDRRALARAWVLLLGALLVLLHVSPAAAAVTARTGSADRTLSAAAPQQIISDTVATHHGPQLGRGIAHSPAPAAGVDADVPDGLGRPEVASGRAAVRADGPVAAMRS